MIGRRIGLIGAPRGIEIVLGAGAVQAGRKRLAVNEDHVVALAVPVPLLGDAQVMIVHVAADVVAAPARFEDDVVAGAADIFAAELVFLVGHALVRHAVGGVLAAPLGMEVAQVGGQGIVLLVVDVVIE